MKLVLAFFLHFVADFILQSREMGKRKSTDILFLVAHLGIQFFVFLPFFGLKFALLNALIHGLIDWNIWKLYKYSVLKRSKNGSSLGIWDVGTELANFKYWEDHLFYTTIGFDQFLHTLTLILLYNYL